MLAELDSLLERMMALPVSQPEEAVEAEERRLEEPPEDLPIITITETVAESAAPPSVPTVSTTSDDLYMQTVLHDHSRDVGNAPEPIPPPEPAVFHHEPQPSPVADLSPERPTSPEPPPDLGPPTPARTRVGALVWCNRGFDRAMEPLGAPGRWLRGQKGRSALGWSGVAMLVVVAGLALFDCLRWTW
jgi:hypothetical protein